MVTGQIIYRMDLEFIYGQNKKERGNYLEIDTKENGKMEKDMGMVHFTMLMGVNMKENGKIT